jgi:hypothetical protein
MKAGAPAGGILSDKNQDCDGIKIQKESRLKTWSEGTVSRDS